MLSVFVWCAVFEWRDEKGKKYGSMGKTSKIKMKHKCEIAKRFHV